MEPADTTDCSVKRILKKNELVKLEVAAEIGKGRAEYCWSKIATSCCLSRAFVIRSVGPEYDASFDSKRFGYRRI